MRPQMTKIGNMLLTQTDDKYNNPQHFRMLPPSVHGLLSKIGNFLN